MSVEHAPEHPVIDLLLGSITIAAGRGRRARDTGVQTLGTAGRRGVVDVDGEAACITIPRIRTRR